MSVGIIIPLKAKIVADNWQLTCQLLENTLFSLKNQTSQSFKVVVVGHDIPELSEETAQLITFSQCSFELRRVNHSGEITHYTQIDRILDKYRKIGQGLRILKKYNCQYYIVLDADDLLHKDLIKYVLQNKDRNGYILHKGYEYYPRLGKVVYRENMADICGSTTVIHSQHVPVPESADDSELRVIPWCFLFHSHMENYFSGKGKPLVEIPFPGLLYTLGHGQNASDVFRKGIYKMLKVRAKLLFKGKELDKKMREDFGIL